MPEVGIRNAVDSDVEFIAYNMRADDVKELSFASPDVVSIVRESVSTSEWVKVLHVDGNPCVLFGVVKLQDAAGASPWMVATEKIIDVPYSFLRESMREIRWMHDRFGFLINQVHRENKTSIQWLTWLGFNIDPEPTGPSGEFMNFWMGEWPCVTQ